MEIRLTAPGKLVLLGEYAVLFGHPAVVTAVDRRARVTLGPAADRAFEVAAPGVVERPASFELSGDGVPRWADDEASQRLGMVTSILSSMTAARLLQPADLVPFSAVLDTSAFFARAAAGPTKLGLGSSAALTVSFASALARWSGHGELLRPPIEWLRRLLGLHRSSQGGRGSGIDLAAGLLGGTLVYQLDGGGDVLRADHVRLPEDLVVRFVWTGRSAATGGFLDRLSARMASDRDGVIGCLEELGAVAAYGIAALTEARTGDFLAAADGYCDGMDRLGRECDMAVLSDVHRSVRRLAKQAGVTYKPSGAGGGDIGLLLTDDPERATAVAERVRGAGYSLLDVATDPTGLS